MKTIEVDNEVFRALEKRATGFGATPNSILRNVLGMNNVQIEHIGLPEDNTNDVESESGMIELIRSAKYVSSNGQKRYLLILSQIYSEFPEKFEEITEFVYGERKHFAHSIEEIEKSGHNTSPREIPGTPFAALTNLSSKRKRKILDDIMKFFEYPQPTIREVLDSMPETKSRNKTRLSGA